MSVFPNYGAIVANTINSINKKSVGLVGDYAKERATIKDKLIALSIMIGVAMFIWGAFILFMWITN